MCGFVLFVLSSFCRKETPSLWFSILTLYSLLTVYFDSGTVLLVTRGVCGGSHTKQFSDTGCCLSHKCRLPFSHYFHIARKILPFLTEKIGLKITKNFSQPLSVWKTCLFHLYFWRIFFLTIEFCPDSYIFNSLKMLSHLFLSS